MCVRRHLDLLVAFGLELLALSPFEDLQAPQGSPGLFRIWFLRLACGPAVKSVHKIISVCVCVSTPAPKVLSHKGSY